MRSLYTEPEALMLRYLLSSLFVETYVTGTPAVYSSSSKYVECASSVNQIFTGTFCAD